MRDCGVSECSSNDSYFHVIYRVHAEFNQGSMLTIVTVDDQVWALSCCSLMFFDVSVGDH